MLLCCCQENVQDGHWFHHYWIPRQLKHLVLTESKLDELGTSLEHSLKSHERLAQEVKVFVFEVYSAYMKKLHA
jgi:hypothetical protein